MRLLLLIIAIAIGITSYADPYKIIDKDSIIKDGVQQLDYLYAYNNKNNRKHAKKKNWYIFYIGGNVAGLKDSIAHYLNPLYLDYLIDQRTSQNIFSAPFVSQLNTLLQTINAQADMEYYVGLTTHNNKIILQLTPQGGTLEDQINYYRGLLKNAPGATPENKEVKESQKKVEALRDWFSNAVNAIYNSSQLANSAKSHKVLSVACEYERMINVQYAENRCLFASRKYSPGTIDGKAFNALLKDVETSDEAVNESEIKLEKIVRAVDKYLHANIDQYKYKFDYRDKLETSHALINQSNNGTPPAELPDPLNSSIYLFDYIGLIAHGETYEDIARLLGGQKAFKETGSSPDGIRLLWDTKMKLYITNHKTPIDIKERINGYWPGINQVMVWLNFEADGTTNISIRFDPNLDKRLKDVLTWNESGFMGKTWLVIKRGSQMAGSSVVSTIYMVTDFLGHVIKDKLTIPRCYWDPECPAAEGGYQNAMAEVFKVILSQNLDLTKFKNILDQIDPNLLRDLQDQTKAVTYPVAFLCGLWNGIVNEVAGVFDGVSMISGAFVDETKAKEMEMLWNQVQTTGLTSLIVEAFKESHKGTSHQIVHQVGKDIVAVAVMAVPLAGELTKAGQVFKVVRITQFVTLLEKLDLLNHLTKSAGFVFKKINGAGKIVFYSLTKAGKTIGYIGLEFVDQTLVMVLTAVKATVPPEVIGAFERYFPIKNKLALAEQLPGGAKSYLGEREYLQRMQGQSGDWLDRKTYDPNTESIEDLLARALSKLDDAIKKYIKNQTDLDAFTAELKQHLLDKKIDIFGLSDDLVEAWDLIKVYVGQRSNFTNLQNAIKVLTNPKLVESGLSKDFLKRMIVANRAKALHGAFELPTFLPGMDYLIERGTKFQDIEQVIDELEKGSNFAVGSGWTMQYVTTHTDEFAGYTLDFEVNEYVIDELNPKNVIREVDCRVKINHDAQVYHYYEFKSVGELPPANFKKQFIKDLRLAGLKSLDELNWVFDARKDVVLVKQDFIDVLNGAPELEDKLILDRFEEFAVRHGYTDAIDDAESLIKYMEERNEWFNAIFKVE